MARLPATEQECTDLMEERLRGVWGRVDIADDADAYFRDLCATIGAELSLRNSICIARAIAGYCYEIRGGLDAEVMAGVTLVKGAAAMDRRPEEGHDASSG